MASSERVAIPRVPAQPAAGRAPSSCEIRVLDSVDDLVEAFRLRYDVCGALGYLDRFNQSRLEIDEYDAWSIPFGAFDSTSGMLIGALRLVTLERQPDFGQLMRRAVADAGDAELTRQALGSRPHPLPSISSPEIWRSIDAFNTESFVVHELSRIIVRPGYQRAGVSRGLMALGLAHAAQYEPAVVVGGCLREQLAISASYGYMELRGIGLDRLDGVGQLTHPVVCRTDQLPEPTRTHVEELLSALASGTRHRTLEVGRNSRAVFRFTAPRRSRRRTVEW
jgi:hypothetical protein